MEVKAILPRVPKINFAYLTSIVQQGMFVG